MTTRLPARGFWSYARKDDDYSDRRVSQLYDKIRKEVVLDYGRPVDIFQDRSDITTGAVWEARIRNAIAQSAFLIPVITPTFLQRPWCFREVRLFLEREKELQAQYPELRNESLIFPIGYREIRDDEALDPDLMAMLRGRQWVQLEELLDLDLQDPQIRREVRKLVSGVSRLLRIPLAMEEEERGTGVADGELERREQVTPQKGVPNLGKGEDDDPAAECKARDRGSPRAKAVTPANQPSPGGADVAAISALFENEGERRQAGRDSEAQVEPDSRPSVHPLRFALEWFRVALGRTLSRRQLLWSGVLTVVIVLSLALLLSSIVRGPFGQPAATAESSTPDNVLEPSDDAELYEKSRPAEPSLNPEEPLRLPLQPTAESGAQTGAADESSRRRPDPEREPQTGAAQFAETWERGRRRGDSSGASAGRMIPEGARPGVLAPSATIQLGTFSRRSGAESAWDPLERHFPDLAPLSHSVDEVSVGGRSLFRLRATGPGAAAVCQRLRQAGEICAVVE